MNTLNNIPTWKALRNSLPELSFETREVIRKATAPERHAARVAAAAEILKEVGLLEGLLELHGVGGPQGICGSSTSRIPAFQNCGKGRKQASDGPAWSEAIREAWGKARPQEPSVHPQISPCEDGDGGLILSWEWDRNWEWLQNECSTVVLPADTRFDLSAHEWAAPWIESIARRAIITIASPDAKILQRDTAYDPAFPYVSIGGTLQEWDALLLKTLGVVEIKD